MYNVHAIKFKSALTMLWLSIEMIKIKQNHSSFETVDITALSLIWIKNEMDAQNGW